MKRSLILLLLVLGAITAKSQTGGIMEYKALPVEGAEETQTNSSLKSEGSLVDAYYLNSYTKKPIKIRLKIVENRYGVFIIASKKLTDSSWSDQSGEPVKPSKLIDSDPMAEYFEYKAFISRLGQTVYF
ncbi:hypothetical protein [Pedobacter hartonius]|uniref:Uncharacterized protein n=1 Tax=Pedobacter hartonius TaxID=425514 RepID=A0A1H4DVK5_9SPHI|nr:hypothetical protein [Pedobacter hartonius]SEA76794.1 hypothetical protein SAMN05443550_105125 [Pedobacter hartonius]